MKGDIVRIEELDWFESSSIDNILLNIGLAKIGLSASENKQYNKLNEGVKMKGFASYTPPYHRHIDDAEVAGLAPTRSGGLINEFDLSGAEYKKSLIDFIKEKLGTLVFEKQKEVFVNSLIPIFKFNSPKIDGCEILYENSTSATVKSSFNMTVFGTGFGKTHKIKFSSTNSFLCTNGSFKLVYIPIKLKCSLMSIVDKKGKTRNEFIKTELNLNKEDKHLNIGIKEINFKEFIEGVGNEEYTNNYLLSRDKTDTVHTFQEVYSKVEDFNYQIGVNAFNINSFCDTSIGRENDIVLKFKFPAGRDYQVKKIMNGLGLYLTEILMLL